MAPFLGISLYGYETPNLIASGSLQVLGVQPFKLIENEQAVLAYELIVEVHLRLGFRKVCEFKFLTWTP